MVLQQATATQVDDSNWIVNSVHGEVLYELPSNWNEIDVMAALHFARKFERRAFSKVNVTNESASNPELQKLKYQVEQLVISNTNLSNELLKQIGENE